jgi:hypothetical protein
MPYIKKDRREEFDKALEQLPLPQNTGELNYVFTKLCIQYFNLKPDGKNYQTINDISGALHCAADEFYRKIAAKYEDKKIDENGDVYT